MTKTDSSAPRNRANRANTLFSPDPAAPPEERSSRNGVTHGLTSRQPRLPNMVLFEIPIHSGASFATQPLGSAERVITEVNLMKPTGCSSILSFVLIASLLLATAAVVFAQSSATKAPRNKREFVAKSHAEWTALNFTGPCSGASTAGGVISNACAEAAIEQTSSECGGSARFFERSSRSWQVVNLLMILASAGFTAVGASTTIANGRLFATLGGTTGLGAVTTTINANSSADAAGLSAVNTTLANFLIFLKSGIVPGATGPTEPVNTAPDNATIYKFAPVFAAQCEAAATSSGK